MTWECFCRRLLDEQEDVSPGRLPNFDAPAALRAQLGLPSFRALYQVGCTVSQHVIIIEVHSRTSNHTLCCTVT